MDSAYKKANQNAKLSDFNRDELRSLLITCDGVGKIIKERALNELIERAEENEKWATNIES